MTQSSIIHGLALVLLESYESVYTETHASFLQASWAYMVVLHNLAVEFLHYPVAQS